VDDTGLASIAVVGIRTAVAAVLIVAGIAKAFEGREVLAGAVRAYGFPRSVARAIAALLPALELATGCALLVGLFMPLPAIAAGLLFLSFAVAMGTALLGGRSVPCPCFGARRSQASWRKVAADVLLAAGALAATGVPWRLRWSWPVDPIPGSLSLRPEGTESEVFLLSYVLLWSVAVLLIIGFAAMVRQIGLIHRRVPALGSRMGGIGPAVGQPAPDFDDLDVLGRRVQLGKARGRKTLLLFVSPHCRVCEDVAPGVRSVARSERSTTDVVLVSADSPESLRTFLESTALTSIPALASWEVVSRYEVWTTPFAILVGEQGTVITKGIVNHIEDLESIVRAGEIGVDSLETWLEARGLRGERDHQVADISAGIGRSARRGHDA
jgi:methylamine dehydrogenase accessory protein MauD